MNEMFQYLKPYRRGLVLATTAMAASTVCDLLLPTIMSEILNNGVYAKNFDYIVTCCAGMFLVALVSLVCVLIGSKISCKVVANFCADVRSAVFRKVNAMSFEEFGKMGTGALVTRATHDVDTVSWIASQASGVLVTIFILFFGGVALSFSKDVMLSLIMLAFLPVIFAIVFVIGRRILPLWEESDKYIDKQNDIMRERLRGIRVIRAFNAENKEHGRIADATRVMAQYIIKGNVAMGLITPLATFLLNLATVLIVYLGGWRMESGSGLTGGDIFAIVQYISLVSSGVVTGAFTIIMLPRAKVAAGRIAQVLEVKGMADPVEKQDLVLNGNICFDQVSFFYGDSAEPALRDISMQISAGEKIGIIGGTGAGKSTLVSMLLGFRMPTKGEVRLDGKSLTELSRHTIRENVSCALQNATIYSGTIRENVRMGNMDATDTQILSALETAQASEFVDNFCDGLDHQIKQSGKNLSGGQKQRLSIARAILKDAPVYIFDDSFSALDFLTEARLRSALAEKIAGKTQIIITQRITSAMHCDRVFVMDRGEIVDSGTHQQLLSRCGVYQEIYASQTGGSHHEETE